jgi:N-acetylglucosaminyldiphosphoundecaprenol N-acetyl-beta-D-mannosaminyltransferase
MVSESGDAHSTIDNDTAAADAHPVDFERRVYCLIGLPIDAVSRRETIDAIGHAVRTRRPLFFSTPNLNFLVSSRTDAAFRDSILHSDLAVADGMPLLWLARLLDIPIVERVAGSDVFEALLRGEGGPLSVYFFGGPPGVAQRACDAVSGRATSMRCAGWSSPGFGTIEELSTPADLEPIVHARPDFLVVSLGGRKGQAWIEHNRRRLAVPVISHLGAVVNFVAGTIVRAPVAFQKTGLEWLWRIKEEPTLWKRYLNDGIGLMRLLVGHALPLALDAARHKRSGPHKPATLRFDPATSTLCPDGMWRQTSLAPLRTALREVTRQDGSVILDLRGLLGIDSAVLGLLLLLHGHQSNRGLALTVYGPPKRVARTMVRHGAGYLLEGLPAVDTPSSTARSGDS